MKKYLYLIKGCSAEPKRRGGIRISINSTEALGIAFKLTGGYSYQTCIGNKILKDVIAKLSFKKIS